MFEDSTFESGGRIKSKSREIHGSVVYRGRCNPDSADPDSADLSRGAAQGSNADGSDSPAASAAPATSAARGASGSREGRR